LTDSPGLAAVIRGSAFAGPAKHSSAQNPPRPPTGTYKTTQSMYVELNTKVRKVGSKQRVWAVAKKFHDDAMVPVNVTMKVQDRDRQPALRIGLCHRAEGLTPCP
jgi:hypothetical protein